MDVEGAADAILDVLMDLPEGHYSNSWGQVLSGLATRTFGFVVCCGDYEYHTTSRALLLLEEAELVRVKRAYDNKKGRANIVMAIDLIA